MTRKKIELLDSLDENKFKKMANERKEWLEKGQDVLVNLDNDVNNYANYLEPKKIQVVVSRILSESSEYVTLVLRSLNGEPLPIFKSGQYTAVTLEIKGEYYTRPFVLTSNPSLSKDGEWRITFKNKSNDIAINYLFNKVLIGEKLYMSAPFGDFYYNPIRDGNKVLFLANSEGIIQAYAMAQAIISNSEIFDLTIYYSEKREFNLLFKDEFAMIISKCPRIKIVYVLSDEEKEGCLTGFISFDKISKEIKDENVSIFISGNEGLLKYLNVELEKLSLPKKFIRYNSFLPDSNVVKVNKFQLVVYINDEKYEIPCYNNKTIMQAIEESGIYIPSKCRVGSCGFCRSELVVGEVRVVNDKRNGVDKKYNYIHPCSTYPLSDIEIVVR